MQAPQTQKKQPPAVLFDSSLEEIDQILALAMLFGFESRRQLRVGSLSTSRFSLQAARFLELIARFYAGDRPGSTISRNPPAIGMSMTGSQTAPTSVLEAVLLRTNTNGVPAYVRTLSNVNETADPVALIRNALSAQVDGNAAVVLA